MAKLKAEQRENENAMYKENLKLKSKIASLKEELKEKDAVIRDKVSLMAFLLLRRISCFFLIGIQIMCR